MTLYLFQLFAHQHKSYSLLVMVHAALKWFHSFVPINGQNPLDDACAKNVIEAAKRRNGNPILKKEPIGTELIKKIIDKFASEGVSLKDLRIAALCTLGLAGFFRFSELSNILCKHIVFLEDHIKMLFPILKRTFTEKGILCTLQKPFPNIVQFLFCLDISVKRSLLQRAIFRCSVL